MLLDFNNKTPSIGNHVFIASTAVIVGDVSVGDFSSIWFNSVVRGDINHIIIGNYSNIQDNCVLHVRKDRFPLLIGDYVTVGHGVIAHGCEIKSNTLLGIGSIVLDGAVINESSIVGAGSLVPPGFIVPSGKLVVGSPCKVIRDLTEEEITSIQELSANYISYSKSYLGFN